MSRPALAGKRRFGPSIARRLMAALFASYVVAWAIIFCVPRLNTNAEEKGEFDMELRSIGEGVERTLDAGYGAPALVGLSMRLEADRHLLGLPPGYAHFEVREVSGRLFARSADGPLADTLPATPGTGFFTVTANGQSQRVLRLVTADGRYRIDVIQSLAARRQAFIGQFLDDRTLMELFILFPVLLLPAWLAVYTGLRPLQRLSRALAARSPGDLSPIGIALPHRELAPVVRELDSTLARLAALLERERAFLADAAHELRTPLALVAAQVDGLQHEPDPREREAAARRLAGGVARCMRLVNQLLALARLESRTEPGDERLDLADLARDTLALHAAEARARGVEIAYVGPDSLPAAGPGAAIESALGNLVANAIRHGHSPGRVEVRLAHQDGGVALAVLDDGPGIPETERARVFDRFVRGRAASGPGSGLGLAIVEAAARQLDARIALGPGLDGAGLAVTFAWHVPGAAAPYTGATIPPTP